MRRAFAFAIVSLMVAGVFAEPPYLVGLITAALGNSSLAIEARADLDAALSEARNEGNRWWPRLSIDSPSLVSFARTGAENVVVLDADPRGGDKNIFALDASAGIEQRLPGSGTARLTASQDTEYASDYGAWRQSPSIELSVSQALGPGAFGVGADPESEKVRLQLEKARLAHAKSADDIVTKALSIMEAMDEADLASRTAAAELEAALFRRDVARAKFAQGAVTRADLWKAETEEASAERRADKADFDRATAADDWKALFGSEPRTLDEGDRVALLEIVGAARDSGDSVELRLLEEESAIDAADRRFARMGKAPQLSLSLSVTPDANAHYFTSRWSDSWTSLVGTSAPLALTGSFGLKYSVPGIGDRAADDESRGIFSTRVAAELAQSRAAASAEILRLRREISRLSSYKTTLDRELARDEEAARDRAALLAKGELSPSDVLDARSDSLRFRSEAIGVEWRLISSQARLAILEGADLTTSSEER
jgi:outer membrane protein TolC